MRNLLLALLFVTATSSFALAREDGETLLKTNCAACHNLQGPAPTSLKILHARKGPDLFYAGDKYQVTWMEAWLQHPKRIRPAGMFYRNHIKPGPKHDVIDRSTLKPHLKLNMTDAHAVTMALMTHSAHADLIKQEKLDRAPSPLGEMMFDKIFGCMACHQIEPDFGGFSGPEVYTAGKRLRPEFILSFIKNPQAWDPKTWMPNKQLSEENAQQLTNYLIGLSKESFDE